MKNKDVLMNGIKGAVWGLIVSVASVLVFAIIVKQTGVEENVISAVNQIVKTVSIFVAALMSVKCRGEKKLLTGMLGGAIYVVLSYLVFSLIEGAFGEPTLLLADLALGIVVGLLVAILLGKRFLAKEGETKQAPRQHSKGRRRAGR